MFKRDMNERLPEFAPTVAEVTRRWLRPPELAAVALESEDEKRPFLARALSWTNRGYLGSEKSGTGKTDERLYSFLDAVAAKVLDVMSMQLGIKPVVSATAAKLAAKRVEELIAEGWTAADFDSDRAPVLVFRIDADPQKITARFPTVADMDSGRGRFSYVFAYFDLADFVWQALEVYESYWRAANEPDDRPYPLRGCYSDGSPKDPAHPWYKGPPPGEGGPDV
jgi:hypothetical protein